jgi:2-hydroxychromene-2-carboxylate isomerase
MKQITFYLDFTSPYAYLAFHALPQCLLGLSYSVVYVPVCLTATQAQDPPPYALPYALDALGAWDALDAAQQAWQQRRLRWLAQRQGLVLEMPPKQAWSASALAHLALACDAQCQPNRFVCETVFQHVWQNAAAQNGAPQPNVRHAASSAASRTSRSSSPSSSQPALHSEAGVAQEQGAGLDAPHWAALAAQLAPLRACSDAAVQQAWQTQCEQATDRGVFALPSWVVDGLVFSGLEALPMLRDGLERGRMV